MRSPIRNETKIVRNMLMALGGIAISVGLTDFRAQADPTDKRTVININGPMQVEDTYLDPGQYVFRLLDSPSNRNIVQIFNADQTHIIGTVLAITHGTMVSDHKDTSGSRFTFWETPAGSVAALRTWYYPGDMIGREFTYPKQLRQIASLAVPALAPPAPQIESAPLESPVVPQAAVIEPPSEQPVEMAQNTPPPPPAAVPEQTEQPSESPVPPPPVLPKTASPYPLIGLMGLLLAVTRL